MLGPKNFGQIIFWIRNILGVKLDQKFVVKKKINWVKENFWSKKILAPKNVGFKKFGVHKFRSWSRIVLGSKKNGFQSILGKRNFGIQQNFGFKKI